MRNIQLLTAALLLLSFTTQRNQPATYGTRLIGNSKYTIMDTAGFPLYRINKLVQGEKIARPQTVYYFSVDTNSPLQELTLHNLETAFASNAKFRYQLDAQFRNDASLAAYDTYLKTFKVEYVYTQTLH